MRFHQLETQLQNSLHASHQLRTYGPTHIKVKLIAKLIFRERRYGPLIFWRQLFIRSSVCFGSLAIWQIKQQLRPSFPADCWKFSFKIFTYPSVFMISSTLTRFPFPDALKHPYSIILVCFTMGVKPLSSFYKHGSICIGKKRNNFFSSHLRMHFQYAKSVSRLSFAYWLEAVSSADVCTLIVHSCPGLQ